MKYIKARTILFFFAFSILRKTLVYCKSLSVAIKKINTQLKFSTDSVKGHGSEECLVEFKDILNIVFP